MKLTYNCVKCCDIKFDTNQLTNLRINMNVRGSINVRYRILSPLRILLRREIINSIREHVNVFKFFRLYV